MRPELVDLDRLDRASTDPLGRFAQGDDAAAATAAYGEQVMEAALAAVESLTREAGLGPADPGWLGFDDVEPAWDAVLARRTEWVSFGQVSG